FNTFSKIASVSGIFFNGLVFCVFLGNTPFDLKSYQLSDEKAIPQSYSYDDSLMPIVPPWQ
ncbi:hypothetical protein QUA81_24550, partial [Microcoleus sp. F6_B4]